MYSFKILFILTCYYVTFLINGALFLERRVCLPQFMKILDFYFVFNFYLLCIFWFLYLFCLLSFGTTLSFYLILLLVEQDPINYFYVGCDGCQTILAEKVIPVVEKLLGIASKLEGDMKDFINTGKMVGFKGTQPHPDLPRAASTNACPIFGGISSYRRMLPDTTEGECIGRFYIFVSDVSTHFILIIFSGHIPIRNRRSPRGKCYQEGMGSFSY